MSSISPTATIIYSGIIAAVITIAINIILFRKLWEKGNKSRDEGISKQGQANTPQPHLIDQNARDEHNLTISTLPDHTVGDEGHLCASVPSPTPLIASSEPQFIGQNARDKSISVPAQAPTTIPPHVDMGGEEVPPITLSQGQSNFQLSETNAAIIRNSDRQFTRIQKDLVYDYISNSITLPNVNYNLKKHVLTQSITTLPRAEAMIHHYQSKKSPAYFKDTIVALLREMADYVTGSSKYRMNILFGPAASGKSTVAYTIASRAAYLNLLGASFCFSRDETDRNNARRFFTTIAYQLCLYNEAFAKAIGEVLETEDGSAATTDDPQTQLHSLILDPLRSIVQSRSRPTLIVVDALDECDEQDAFPVLTGLSALVRDLPSFKVILTTRPQPYLDRFLRSWSGHILVCLQDIENKVVDGDIRLYLNHCLSLDQVQMRFPEWQWCASDQDIDSLVRAAGRGFIIASTAVRYILDKTASNPAAQTEKLLRDPAQDHSHFKNLDRFYTVILRDVIPEQCEDNSIISRYQLIVGTIVLVQHPLPVSTLAHLIGIDVEEIRALLDKLQSVILLGDDDVPQMYHKSFPKYLMDQSRCKDVHLRIDPKICHTQIAIRCFEIMNKRLKYNILGLGDLAQFMSNEDGLEEDGITDEQLEEKIPQQLHYACVYWVYHLEVANIEDAGGVINRLARFLDEHILHWFEVLSLIGELDLAHFAIDVVSKLLKSSSNLHQLLSDALRFIERSYKIIERSALHTYYSALLFTPTDSQLYRRYIKEAQTVHICAIEGGPEKYYHALIAELRHGDYSLDVIKFSLDGSLFMSYSDIRSDHTPGKLTICDAATGTSISILSGDNFAVANDFSTITSSTDTTAALYDMNGDPSGAKFSTSSKIQKLALSIESSRVAVALCDGTVWLWESRNAELIDTFDGFEDSDRDYSQLEFSPTGKRLAYSSANGINLREGISGRFIADLRCGKFKFSADGSRIAATSMSLDDSLTLWNSDSGGLIQVGGGEVWDDVGYPQGLAISANGSLLATANHREVTLWSGNNDSLAPTKVLEVYCPGSMTFSLNSILAIATSYYIKLYDIKTHSFIHSLPVYGSNPVLAISPDCTRFAIGYYYGYADLYDIRGIDQPSKEATAVTRLALSQDCLRLACGFEDGTVELWGTTPTKRRIASHQAHEKWVKVLEFGPSGGLFASGCVEGTIKLWNSKDGSLRAALKVPSGFRSVALSNSVLVAAEFDGLALWSLDTLSLIHTCKISSYDPVYKISIAENNALIAVAKHGGVSLLDAENHKTITTFHVDDKIHTMAFLPDNLHLMALSEDGVFLTFNLINKHITKGVEHLIQLPNISFWRGVPIWHCQDRDSGQHYFVAMFSQHKSPVPVLWIPRCIDVMVWTQGSSMIALGCRDGRVILLRLSNSHVS